MSSRWGKIEFLGINGEVRSIRLRSHGFDSSSERTFFTTDTGCKQIGAPLTWKSQHVLSLFTFCELNKNAWIYSRQGKHRVQLLGISTIGKRNWMKWEKVKKAQKAKKYIVLRGTVWQVIGIVMGAWIWMKNRHNFVENVLLTLKSFLIALDHLFLLT